MNVVNRLTLRSLKLNKRRTIVTIFGIIIAAAMITGVSIIAASIQDMFVQTATQTAGNFHATFYGVSADKIGYITENPYTKTAMLSRDLGFADFKETVSERLPYILIKEYDALALTHMPIRLKEGRFPQKEGEMVVSEEIITVAGDSCRIGRNITLAVGNRLDQGAVLTNEPYRETETLEPISVQTFTITGVIETPRFVHRSGSPRFTAITYLDAGKLPASGPVNVSILAVSPKKIFEKVPAMAEISAAERFAYNNELLKWQGITANTAYRNMLTSVFLIISILIAAGAVAVIYNAFAISVSERKKQFGMLASVGATPAQIRRSVFFEGAVLGAIGIPVGILLGYAGIGITLSAVNRLMIGIMLHENVALRPVFSPTTIFVTLVFISLIIFLSAYIPARTASRISPIDAIRLSQDIKISGKQLKTSRLTRFLFGIEGELALKNLKRNSRRYRATVFSLFVSIVLFVSISSFLTFAFQSTDMYYVDIPHSVTAQKLVPLPEQKEFFARAASLDMVERYAMVRAIGLVSDHIPRSQFGSHLDRNYLEKGMHPANPDGSLRYYFPVTAVGEREFDAYLAANGLNPEGFRDKETLKAILVNKAVDHVNGAYVEFEPLLLEVGDSIVLSDDYSLPAGFSIEVGAVTDNVPMGVVLQGGWTVNLIVSDDVFDAILPLLHEEVRRQTGYARHLFATDDSAGLVAKLNELNALQPAGVFDAWNNSAEQQEMRNTRTVIAIFLYGFLALITLIGVTNIFNTISTNVALRRREFAMLKSVGLTPGGFNKMINYESIFYGLKALLYGLPVSIAVSVLMYHSFGHFFSFTFFLPYREIIYCIAGVFIIVYATMLYAGSKLKHDNIIDALKAENL